MRLLCLIVVTALLCGPAARADSELRNAIAAIVNDTIITYQELEDYTASAVEVLRSTYRNQRDAFLQHRAETLSDGLEQLIEKQLIIDEFKNGGARVPESYIDDEIKDHIRQRYRDRAALTKELQAQGITSEAFRQRMHDEIVVNYMRQKNVSAAVLISPQKIERFYATNLHEFQLAEQVKLRMIVLKREGGNSSDESKRLAQEILRKIDEGATFSEMAAVYSEGSQRREGGDWGWKSAADISKGVADIAFDLKRGQHSNLFGFAREPDDSYWIYQYDKAGKLIAARKYTGREVFVEEKKFDGDSNGFEGAPPQEFRLMLVEDRRVARTKPLSEVREQIERELIAQERKRLQKQWIAKLRSKAFVRFF